MLPSLPLRRLLLLLALGFALAAPEANAAGWLPPVDVPGSTIGALGQRMAVDGQGNLWLAWVEAGPAGPTARTAYVTKRPVGGSFEAPQQLFQTSLQSVEVDIGADGAGNAVVMWREPLDTLNGEMRMAQRLAGETAFGAPADLTPITATPERLPRLVVSSSGKIAAVWVSEDINAESSARTASGTTGGTVTTTAHSAGTSRTADLPTVAENEAGAAVAVWRTTGAGIDKIEAAFKSPEDAAFPSVASEEVANDTANTFQRPSATIDSTGEAVVAWESTANSGALRAKRRDVNSQLWVGLNDLDGGHSVGIPVLASDAGNTLAAWTATSEVQASQRPPGLGFGTPPLVLAGSGEQLIEFSGSASPTGGLALVWKSQVTGNPVRAIVRPSGGPFGPVATISAPGHSGGQPRVGIGGPARAAAVWSDSDGSGARLASAVYDATAPSFSSVDVPAAGTAGSAIAFTAAAGDDWSTPALSWDFGDGASGSGAAVSHTYAAAGKYTVTTTATDSAGNVASAAHTIDVAAAQVPPTPGPPLPPIDLPTRGVDFNASKVSGTVFVSVPKNAPAGRVLARRPVARAAAAITPPRGFTPFRPLGKDDNIPVGSILDASRGITAITMASNKGGSVTQKGSFSKGVFKTKQSKAAPLTTATMLGGGNFKRDCSKPKLRASRTAVDAARRPSRRLFANVKGRFRTRGRHSTATVRGTQYLVKDSCAGTLTSVLKGSVVVRDLVKKRSRVVKAGHKYLAKPKRLRRRR